MDARETAKNDVLRRKASVGRAAFEAHGMSPEKALNRALTRSAETQWNLALLARDVHQFRVDQASCEEMLRAGGLILLLDGPNGAPGFALIDPGIVAGLIEVQTFGTISTQDPEDRPFTSTDAAMMAPLLDQGMKNFARLLEGTDLCARISGFRFGAHIDAPRVAGMLMDSAFYHVFRAQVDLGGGCRTGQMMLAFPERPAPDAEDEASRGDASPRHLQAMLTLPAYLDAVLCRLTLPLCDVEAFEVGQTLLLPRDALTRAELCGAGGQPIAAGTLGRMNGQRALRLNDGTGKDGAGAGPDVGPLPVPVPGAAAATPAGADLSFQQMVDAAPSPEPDPAPMAQPMVDLPDIPDFDDLPEMGDLPPLDLDSAIPPDPLGGT